MQSCGWIHEEFSLHRSAFIINLWEIRAGSLPTLYALPFCFRGFLIIYTVRVGFLSVFKPNGYSIGKQCLRGVFTLQLIPSGTFPKLLANSGCSCSCAEPQLVVLKSSFGYWLKNSYFCLYHEVISANTIKYLPNILVLIYSCALVCPIYTLFHTNLFYLECWRFLCLQQTILLCSLHSGTGM